jgi:hypothetical protein
MMPAISRRTSEGACYIYIYIYIYIILARDLTHSIFLVGQDTAIWGRKGACALELARAESAWSVSLGSAGRNEYIGSLQDTVLFSCEIHILQRVCSIRIGRNKIVYLYLYIERDNRESEREEESMEGGGRRG